MPNLETATLTFLDLQEPDLEQMAQMFAANLILLVQNYNARQQQSGNYPVGITYRNTDMMSRWMEQDITRLNAYYWVICRQLAAVRNVDRYAPFDPEPYRILAVESVAPPPPALSTPAMEDAVIPGQVNTTTTGGVTNAPAG